jgi:hypothetical protein
LGGLSPERDEATLAIQLQRQVEAVKRRAGHRAWDIGVIEPTLEDEENLPLVGCLR